MPGCHCAMDSCVAVLQSHPAGNTLTGKSRLRRKEESSKKKL